MLLGLVELRKVTTIEVQRIGLETHASVRNENGMITHEKPINKT
ncbi:hypothetical protein [Bacillus sp. FJAT-29814]|nr:hypothetical protein [Bacillus sp. FJAT-29814]